MHEDILDLFKEHLEKQDMLSHLTESDALHEYGYSEEHTIEAIGTLERPNVTAIAEHLKMTRGAISKIAKRLQDAGLAESYKLPTNRKEVYFRLTPAGQRLFDDHEERHGLWRERDEAFFDRYTHEQLEFVRTFMTDFNSYLEKRIEALSKGQK